MKNNSSFRQFSIVLKHEYGNMIKSKFFRGFTLVILLGIILLMIIVPMTANKSAAASSPAAKSLLVVDNTGMFSQSDFSSISGYTVTFQQGNTTVDQLKTQISNGTYDDAALLSNESQGKIGITFVAKSVLDSMPQNFQTLIAAANIKNIMTRYSVPSSAIEQALTAPDLTVITTSGNSDLMSGFLPSYIMILLLFYTIVAYGAMVASGVAQEKSSRAMELLITSAQTKNLIMGKIIGIGLSGLTQLAIWVVGLFVFYRIEFSYWQNNAIMSGLFGMNASHLLFMLLFYLLGFFMFAALFGAIGSLVSRTEEIQIMQLPVILLLLIGLLVSIMGMLTPGPLLTVFSFIPIYTPMSMFARMNTSVVPWWQIALSIALSAAAVAAISWAAVKIYRIGVLMYGKTPSIKEVVRALRSDKRG